MTTAFEMRCWTVRGRCFRSLSYDGWRKSTNKSSGQRQSERLENPRARSHLLQRWDRWHSQQVMRNSTSARFDFTRRSPILSRLKRSRKQYVRFGPVDKALPWLTGAATVGSDVDRLGLLAEAYGKLGNRSRLLEVRCQLWENTLSAEALREYIELLPPSERYEARRHAIEKASHSDDVVLGTTLLLSLGESANASAVALRAARQAWSTRTTPISLIWRNSSRRQSVH